MRLVSQDDGQTSVEYGFVLAMIVAVLVLALAVGVVGPATEFFENIPDLLPF